MKVTDELVREALGNPKFDFKLNERITKPGVAIVKLIILIFRVWLILKLVEKHY